MIKLNKVFGYCNSGFASCLTLKLKDIKFLKCTLRFNTFSASAVAFVGMCMVIIHVDCTSLYFYCLTWHGNKFISVNRVFIVMNWIWYTELQCSIHISLAILKIFYLVYKHITYTLSEQSFRRVLRFCRQLSNVRTWTSLCPYVPSVMVLTQVIHQYGSLNQVWI